MNGDSTTYHSSDGRPLTPAEVARLDAIEARLGESDEIPETSDAAWATAVRGKHSTAMQGAVAVRLDADVAAWLRGKGTDPQAVINRILRERMASEA